MKLGWIACVAIGVLSAGGASTEREGYIQVNKHIVDRNKNSQKQIY